MLSATLKGLLARKLRLFLSGLAVVLGVMFVAGSFVLTDTLGRSFDALFADVYSHTEVRVQGTTPLPTGLDEEEPPPVPLPAELVRRTDEVPGVASAHGVVSEDGARLIGANGKVVTTTFGRPRLGTNWSGEGPLTRLREGRGPGGADEIAINAMLAKAAEVSVGDRVGVLTRQPKRTFTVVGILEYSGGRDSLGGSPEIAFHESVAAELMLGEPGVFSAIDVRAERGVTPTELRHRLRAALGSDYDVRTGAELRRADADESQQDLRFVNSIFLGFAGVALFVGIFLILNTFSIIVAQRTRELALMRALGASRRQVVGSVLVEATAIGLLASGVGLGLGIGVGWLGAWALGRLDGGDLELAGVGVPAAAVAASLAVGLAVTVIAALVPALRTARIPPMAALQEAATPDRPLTRLTMAGAVTGAIGGVVLAVGLAGGLEASLPVLLVGVLICLVAVALLTPAVARPTVSVIGRLLSWSTPGRLGRLNSARNPRRTAITAGALMVGVALVTGVSTVLASATVSLTKTADEQFNADLIIAAEEGEGGPAFDRAVLERTRALKGVDSVAGIYRDAVLVGGERTGLTAVSDLRAWESMLKLRTVDGTVSGIGRDEVIVDTETADADGLRVGAPVRFTFADGHVRTLTVAGIFDSDWSGGWITSDAVVADMTVKQPNGALVVLEPDAPAGKIRKQIEAMLVDNPETVVTDHRGFLDMVFQPFDTVLLMVQVLLALAMLIAVLGIVNTLALSVLERVRELGLLRAVGLSRMQAVRMVTVEAVVISTFGALLGVAVGVGLGAAVVRALEQDGVDQLALPWGYIGGYLVLGAVIGVLAAVLPAIRAARVDVLRAIAYE
jgi:putative ABC transport system permease protein